MSYKYYEDQVAPGTGRVYDIQDVSGGKSITDITTYTVQGSTFGATDINAIGVLEANYAYSTNVHAITTSNTTSENIKFTATTAYSKGDTFTFNGTTVTAKMMNGDPLPGGYFEANAVVFCVKSGNTLYFPNAASKDLYTNTTLSGVTLWRVGNVVTCNVNTSAANITTTKKSLGTIPSGYRPTGTITTLGGVTVSGTPTTWARVTVESNVLYAQAAASANSASYNVMLTWVTTNSYPT